MNRAYSLLEIRSVDEEKRVIEGIATTPELALDGDILETDGIQFKLPLPFLLRHDQKLPLGNVVKADVSKDGIHVRVEMAPAGVADHIDEAWRMIKAKVVRGLSMGWKTIAQKFDPKIGGYRISKSLWLELSAVPVPADMNATILSVRSADAAILAALGTPNPVSVVRLTDNLPGVSGPSQIGKSVSKTIQETITASEAKMAANDTRVDALLQRSIDAGTTPEVAEKEEIATLKQENVQLADYVALLKERAEQVLARATPITPKNTETEEKAEKTRRSEPIQVRSMAPKGIGMARMAIAVAAGALTYQNPLEIARRRWPDAPEVEMYLRTAIEAGDTTTSGWASQLVPAAQNMADDFLELYRPQTIIGRIPGLRNVPFNVSVPLETASGTAAWVGEGAPKPVTKLTLSSVTLRFEKAAAIVVITDELARFSTPNAEMTVRDSMTKTLIRFFDTHFVSTTAAVSNVSPAGILNGISSTATTGTSAAAFRTDMSTLLDKMTANNVPLSNVVLLMSSTQAVNLSLLVTDLGVALFPNITREGGSILGFPVIISEAVGTKIIAINASDILLASDPGVRVDVSREASVEMSDTPILGDTSPITGAVIKSLWQNNLLGIRFEQYQTWKVARAASVEYLTSVAYKA